MTGLPSRPMPGTRRRRRGCGPSSSTSANHPGRTRGSPLTADDLGKLVLMDGAGRFQPAFDCKLEAL